MSVYRKWFCNCTGKLLEMSYEELLDGEEGENAEPFCEACGAIPSSDPHHTVSYQDVEEWDE